MMQKTPKTHQTNLHGVEWLTMALFACKGHQHILRKLRSRHGFAALEAWQESYLNPHVRHLNIVHIVRHFDN